MTTETARAGAAHPGSARPSVRAALQPTDQNAEGTAPDRHWRDLPIGAAVAVPPIGQRRRLWMLWAASRGYAGYADLHRAGSPVGGVQREGCGQGSYYVLVVREQGRAAA